MPLILCNYDRFYLGLMHFLKACDTNGTLAAPELKDVLLADSNEEVMQSFDATHHQQTQLFLMYAAVVSAGSSIQLLRSCCGRRRCWRFWRASMV